MRIPILSRPRPYRPPNRLAYLVTRKQYSRTRRLVCVMAFWAVICGIGFSFLVANVVHADAKDRAEEAVEGNEYDNWTPYGFIAVVPCVFVGLPLALIGCCSLLAGGLSFNDLRHMEPIADTDGMGLQDTLVRGSVAPTAGQRTELLRVSCATIETDTAELLRTAVVET